MHPVPRCSRRGPGGPSSRGGAQREDFHWTAWPTITEQPLFCYKDFGLQHQVNHLLVERKSLLIGLFNCPKRTSPLTLLSVLGFGLGGAVVPLNTKSLLLMFPWNPKQPEAIGCSYMAIEILYMARGCLWKTSITVISGCVRFQVVWLIGPNSCQKAKRSTKQPTQLPSSQGFFAIPPNASPPRH